MATLPANDDMTGAGVTQGQFKARLNDLLTFCRDVFGSNGTVTAVASSDRVGHTVEAGRLIVRVQKVGA